MRNAQSLQFGILVAAFVLVASASAIAGTSAAPAPLLGSGILGAIVLAAGSLLASRRKP